MGETGTPVVGDGFVRNDALGLFVPEEYRREREVWTREEWMVLERATKLLTSRGINQYLACPDKRCVNTPIERLRMIDGGILLRCEHRDRVMVRFRRG